jgi:hypothetical protein
MVTEVAAALPVFSFPYLDRASIATSAEKLLILAERYGEIPQGKHAQNSDYCGNEGHKKTIRPWALHLRAPNCSPRSVSVME